VVIVSIPCKDMVVEILQNFEQAAKKLDGAVLVATGLAALLFGLFSWLGGLGFRKILAAVTGAATGGIGAFLITDKNWTLVAVSALIVCIIGLAIENTLKTSSSCWRLIIAICSATSGTILIFAAMIMLLIHKGATPTSYIINRQLFYGGVFAAMAVFGTVEQLLLCPKAKTTTSKKPVKPNDS